MSIRKGLELGLDALRKGLFLLLAVSVIVGLTGCEGWPLARKGSVEAADVAQSKKERVSVPQVAEGDIARLVAGNTAFAFDLYQAVRREEGNIFYSPYSISVALAMTYAGAHGETKKQMGDTLHFTLAEARLHPAFNALDMKLVRRDQGGKGGEKKGFKLHIANSLWGQKGHKFLSEFLDVLAENYGAGLRLVDFAQAAEQTRLIINEWVSRQTESKIKDLIPAGLIDGLTRLVLVNAIYFDAAWAHPFEEKMTQDGTFHLVDGGQVTVPMMRQTEHFGYAEGKGYQAVELPYEGGEMAMVILLPEDGSFERFEASLNSEQVTSIVSQLGRRRVSLTLPRFEFESRFRLREVLAAIGMEDAFEPGTADFSGMDGTRDLYIDEVVHKAFVSVDEAGTEAAAATAVIMRALGMPEEPIEVTVDHPFIFLIRDIETGTILFVGRVVNPSA